MEYTVSRDFLCSGLPFFSAATALFGHSMVVAVVQVAGAFAIAAFVSERWQRWRQRRDFQYRAMATLASASADVFKVLREMLHIHTDKYDRERHQELRREYAVKMLPLLALDADFYGTFDDESLMPDFVYLTGVLNAAHGIVLGRAGSIDQTERDQAHALLKCVTAQRRLMIVKMYDEMDLVRPAAGLSQNLERRARDLPAGVTIPAVEDA